MDRGSSPAPVLPWLSDRRVPHSHRQAQPIYVSVCRVVTTTRCVLCGRPKDDGVHDGSTGDVLDWLLFMATPDS